MNHIQNKFEGTTLQKWELDHGIVRVVRGGCEYVMVADPDKFAAACAEDDIRHAREQMKWALEEGEIPNDIF